MPGWYWDGELGSAAAAPILPGWYWASLLSREASMGLGMRNCSGDEYIWWPALVLDEILVWY